MLINIECDLFGLERYKLRCIRMYMIDGESLVRWGEMSIVSLPFNLRCVRGAS